jgi:deaminated glutathione amidase
MSLCPVAVVQMTSTSDVAANLAAAEQLIERAARAGAKLAVLPEGFAFVGPDGDQRAHAEQLPELSSGASDGPILARCRAWARQFELELVLGGFWEQAPDTATHTGRVYNACLHLSADGRIKSVYRKIHLFDVDLADGTVLRESKAVAAGEQTVVSDAPFGRLGLSICYDLRFPELYRRLVDDGAIALAVPAAFTLHTGKDHWHILLQARAIESQSYVLAAAQTGKHYGTRVSYGHALIADPWGCVVAQCGEGPGVAVASIDTDLVTRIRSQLPSLQHRRL